MARPRGAKNKGKTAPKAKPAASDIKRKPGRPPASEKKKPNLKVVPPQSKPKGKPLSEVLPDDGTQLKLPCLETEPVLFMTDSDGNVDIHTIINNATPDLVLSEEVAAAQIEDCSPPGEKPKKRGKKGEKDISIPVLDPSIISCDALQREIQSLTLQQAFDIQEARRVYQTGCVGLDAGLGKIDPKYGNGGLQELGIYETYGPKGVRKSNFWELVAKYILDDDPTNICVFLYTEDPDTNRLRNMGLPVGGRFQIMGLYNPATPDVKLMLAEQRLMDICVAATYKNVKLIVIDSLKALVSMTQMFKKGDPSKGTKPIEEDEVAIRAKLMEKMLNRLLGQRRSAILGMTNHMTEHIPNKNDRFVVALNEQDRTPAGTLKEFLSAVRIRINGKALYEESKIKIGAEKDTEHNPQAGILQIYTVRHNRWGRPKIKVVAPFDFGDGPGMGHFDRSLEIFTLGVHCKLITTTEPGGHMFVFKEGKANGKEAALLYLDEHVPEREEIYKKIIAVGPSIYTGTPGKHLSKAKTKSDGQTSEDESEVGVSEVDE